MLILQKSAGLGCMNQEFNRCTCGIQLYDVMEQYVVNCSDLGLRNADILKYLPEQTQVLIFTGNNISELPWNVFGTLNTLENLRVVDMSNNRIKEIKGKTYHHVQNVERLILNHNELVISSDDDTDVNYHHPRVFSNFINLRQLHLTNAFADNTDAALANDLHDIFVNSNLTKLEKLHLEQNEIMSFRDRRVFCDLPNLMDLHLSDNSLTGLNFDVTCLKHLRFLDLEDNDFEMFTKKELNTLDKIATKTNRENNLIVDLRGNLFRCTCELFDFHNWLRSTNVTVRFKETLKCSSPKAFIKTPIIKLKITPCKLASAPRNGSTKSEKVTIGFLLFFTMLLMVTTLYCFYHRRYQLKSKLSPVVEAISRKVQYSTLKNKDNVDDI